MRFEALEPIHQGVRGYVGGFANGIARGLAVRHFGTIDELRQAPLAIRETYNTASMNRATWISDTGRVPPGAASLYRQGGVGFVPVSQKP